MADPVHEHLLMTYMEGNHSLRTATHRLNRYRDGSVELYNLQLDPQQLHNLSNSEASQATKKAMLSKLDERLRGT